MSHKDIQTYQQSLVQTLKQNGAITTSQVEAAFLQVPRHLFLPGEPLDTVYSDVAIVLRRVEEGVWTSSSSQPAIMAIMLEQLDLQPGQRVLEIGTGSGFNAALIAAMVGPEGEVVTIDIQSDLVEHARECLDGAGYEWVQTAAGDGGYGFAEGAPFDRIILTVGSAVIAPAWREQLAPDGRLVLPLDVGTGDGMQVSVAFRRQGEELVSVSVTGCGFMMLQGAFAPAGPVRTPVGPDPRLFISTSQELTVPAERLSGWLDDPGKDWASGVTVALREVLDGLPIWLVAHEPRFAHLSAMGELAERGMIPSLLGFGGEWKSVHTFALVQADGLAALMRPPGQAAPLEDMNELGADTTPFELYVRQLGPGEQAARRLLEIVQGWDQAGKPGSASLHLRAIPTETEYNPRPGEYLLDKPWTKLVISYPPS
jgi:protein-L-isoaspartate(D-aspartate) O-methyltransferase